MRRGVFVGLALCCTSAAFALRVEAADADPWLGKDKALHFGASAVIGAGGYAVGAAVFDARYKAMLLGSGAGLAAGAAKELVDLAGHGDPSWRDFTWDVIGTVVGVGLAWGLDLAIRGAGKEHPVIGSRSAGLVLSW